MRISGRSMFFHTFLTVSIAALLPSSGSAEEYVSVSVKGTRIDVLPDAVEVISDYPREVAMKLENRGGRVIPADSGAYMVVYNKVDYAIIPPKIFNAQVSGFQFRAGHIIYVFRLDSEKDTRKFVKRYHLKRKTQIIKTNGIKSDLYGAEPGYFVRFASKRIVFVCSMHPEVQQGKSGKCPKCGMNLVQMEVVQ